MTPEKHCFIFAGPNGAGKSTFAMRFLRHEVDCKHFVNADLIAAGLSPLDSDLAAVEAGRMVIERAENFVAKGETFGLETTLSGRGYLSRIKKWRSLGYTVILFYLRIPDPEFAVERVKQRVSAGGHHVPHDDIRRRFERSWKNFQDHYRHCVDQWVVYDMSSRPPMILEQSKGEENKRD